MSSSKFAVILLGFGVSALANASAAAGPLIPVNELLSVASFGGGGGGVGNGGGTVVCRNPDQTVRTIEVLDLYEAREIRGIEIDLQTFAGNWKEKVQGIINRLGTYSQLRLHVYSEWLKSFDTESMRLSGVVFNNVPDAMMIAIPKGCAFEQAAVQIVPRFTGDHRYYINDELWLAMDETQKAALVLHELIYREALSYGHSDSIATRYFLSRVASASLGELELDGFIGLLRQSHFEQTDVPIGPESQPPLVTVFDPVNLWRPGYFERYPGEITLRGRMVVNLGLCVDEGCRKWRDVPVIWLGDQIELYNCGGLVGLFEGDASLTIPVHRQDDFPERCGHATMLTAFGWSESAPGWTDIYVNRLRDAYPLAKPRYDMVQKGAFDAQLQLLFYKFFEGAPVLQSAAGLYFNNENWVIKGPMAGENPSDACSLVLDFDPGNRLSGIQFLRADEAHSVGTCRPEIYFRGPEFSAKLSLVEGSDVIAIDSESGYRRGGRIVFMGDRNSRLLECVDGKPCMQAVSEGFPAELVTVHGPVRIEVDAVKPGDLTYRCELADSMLHLHSTQIPQVMTLAKPCSFRVVDGEVTTYDKGAVLRMSEHGEILEVL